MTGRACPSRPARQVAPQFFFKLLVLCPRGSCRDAVRPPHLAMALCRAFVVGSGQRAARRPRASLDSASTPQVLGGDVLVAELPRAILVAAGDGHHLGCPGADVSHPHPAWARVELVRSRCGRNRFRTGPRLVQAGDDYSGVLPSTRLRTVLGVTRVRRSSASALPPIASCDSDGESFWLHWRGFPVLEI